MVSVTKQDTPALRFDGFDGGWEYTRLADIAHMYQPQTVASKELQQSGVPVFGANGYIGFYHKANHVSDQVTISARGENTGTPSYVVGPVWITGNSMVVNVDSSGVDKRFLYGNLSSRSLKSLVTGGAQSQLTRVVLNEFQFSLPPTPEEQRAIGELFADLDALIEQHRAKHANLQQTKTALMQRMFPQDGADEPELRLGGFSGAWEIQPFSDLVAYRGNNSLSRADLTDVPTAAMNIHYGDILVKYDSVVDVSQTDVPFVQDVERLSNVSRQSLSDGDVLFADAAEDSTVGKCVEVQGISANLVLAGLHTISARPVRAFAPGFLGHALNAPSFHNQLLLKMQGTKVSSISTSTLAETVFAFPTLEEQRAIGEVFFNLDALITVEHRYITQLTQAKTALLQRMFV